MVRTLSEEDCKRTQELWAAFDRSKSDQDLIRIVLSRLNLAMRRVQLVDQAIDLGIALEGLLLYDMNDDRGEPTFRLRIRGSRLLGATLDERKHLFDLLRDIYTLRSSAVHAGRLSSKYAPEEVRRILDEGFGVCARAIAWVLENGRPDWTTLMLK